VRPDDEVAVAVDQDEEYLPISSLSGFRPIASLSGQLQAGFMTFRPISDGFHDFQARFRRIS